MKKNILIKYFTLLIIILTILFFVNKLNIKDSSNKDSLRVVSIGGNITEIIYALEKGSLLVGNDTTSYFPEEANRLPKVGYQRSFSVEGIVSLNPNLVFLSHEAGPPLAREKLKGTGIKVIELPNLGYSVDAVKKNISFIARYLNAEKQGRILLKSIDDDWKLLKRRIANQASRKKVLLILGHGHLPLVAGKNTAADKIIEISGAINPISYNGYKPLTPEEAIHLAPDFIVYVSNENNQGKIRKILLSIPGISISNAVKNNKIIILDSLFVLGFGNRVIKAALKLNSYIDK